MEVSEEDRRRMRRLGASSKAIERDDLRFILEAGHALDERYIAAWAEAWSVAELWRNAGASG
jgi:hypothetical protein